MPEKRGEQLEKTAEVSTTGWAIRFQKWRSQSFVPVWKSQTYLKLKLCDVFWGLFLCYFSTRFLNVYNPRKLLWRKSNTESCWNVVFYNKMQHRPVYVQFIQLRKLWSFREEIECPIQGVGCIPLKIFVVDPFVKVERFADQGHELEMGTLPPAPSLAPQRHYAAIFDWVVIN